MPYINPFHFFAIREVQHNIGKKVKVTLDFTDDGLYIYVNDEILVDLDLSDYMKLWDLMKETLANYQDSFSPGLSRRAFEALAADSFTYLSELRRRKEGESYGITNHSQD